MKISEQSDRLQAMSETDQLQTKHELDQLQTTTETETKQLQARAEGEHIHPNLLPESIESEQESEQREAQRGVRKLKQLRKALHERVNVSRDSLNTVGESIRAKGQDSLNTVGNSIKARGKHIQTISESIATSGKERIKELHTSFHEQSQRSLTPVNQKILDWHSKVMGLGTSGVLVTNALKDLPRTIQELLEEMPLLANKIQQAGVRDVPRTDPDTMALFQKIPSTVKLHADENSIFHGFLKGRNGSHIKPHSDGGGVEASNILWELRIHDRSRGAQMMTSHEQMLVRFRNGVDAFIGNSKVIARLGLSATAMAVLVQSIVTAFSYTLDLQRGDISVQEFKEKVQQAAVDAGISTVIFFPILIAVMSFFPEIGVLLSAPIVINGFNALFGINIAMPIIQSFIRHSQAGGFDELKDWQEQTVLKGEAITQQKSQEIREWWNQLLANTNGENLDTSPEV